MTNDTRLPDNSDLRRLAEALADRGQTLTPHPEFPGEWIAPCPLCATAGNPDGTMTIYLSAEGRHVDSVVYACNTVARHKLYDIGVVLDIHTSLMDAIDAGRAELRTVLAAMSTAGITYKRNSEAVVTDSHHGGQCPWCVRHHHDGYHLEIYVEDDVEGEVARAFGDVCVYCERCESDPAAILAEIGVVTRHALRESFGTVAWDAPEQPQKWAVEPLVERGQFAKIYGPAKSGKSLYAQDQAFRLAEQGVRVLYLDHENPPGEVRLRRRAMGYQAAPPDTLTYLTFPPVSALDTPSGAARFHALVETTKPDVIFLDTWSKFVNGDEDSPTTHTTAYNTAIVPVRRRGITVIALDHSGKDVSRGPRGGSSKGDNVDVLWLLTAKADNRLRLERRASRTGRGPDLVELVRHEEPLRHQRADEQPGDVLTAEVRACIAKLDELEVPPGWGRERALQVLHANEVKIRAMTLSAAIRVRKDRGNALAGTLDLSSEQVEIDLEPFDGE